MSYYKFTSNDIFHNTIETNPKVEFFIYSGSIYYNSNARESGSFTDSVLHISGTNLADGHPGVSLYEMNVDRPDGSMVYSFITKGGSRASFKTISSGTFDDISQYQYGDDIRFNYPMTASITRFFYEPGDDGKYLKPLKNTINYYRKNSLHFIYSGSSDIPGPTRNLDDVHVNLIDVPSIFYGSSIEPGTVKLEYFVSGTLISRLEDVRRNGELKQTYNLDFPSLTGSVGGLCLYKEGIFILTGANDLSNNDVDTYEGGTDLPAKWIYFGSTGSYNGSYDGLPSSSFYMSFEGRNNIETMTLMAHAPRNELNNSTHPTFIDKNEITGSVTGSSRQYISKGGKIKNIEDSEYPDPEPDFVKQTYISKVGIYDKHKNLIAVAKLATPIRKREQDQLTFKLKMDF